MKAKVSLFIPKGKNPRRAPHPLQRRRKLRYRCRELGGAYGEHEGALRNVEKEGKMDAPSSCRQGGV